METTREIADFVTKTTYESLPESVVHEAKRDIINVLGVSIYAARDPSLKILTDMFDAEGGNPRASIWGAGRKTTLANAALANGYLAHLEDFDDTHFPTVMHPTSPTLAAAYPVGEEAGKSGKDLIAAVALGIEACCRICNAVHPWHYDLGWHITGTMGVFGAAVAAGHIAGLETDRLVAAMGAAGTQAAGVREAFGTMTKPMHAGRAAQAGVVSTLLARGGFTAAMNILEGRRGVTEVMSDGRDLSRVTAGLGQDWEIFKNGLKPYACGVVSHPAIDAAIAIHGREGFDPDTVESIDAYVHPLVPELMGRMEPDVGLAGKFSCAHTIACGLIDGAAFPAQFTDAKVKDEKLTAMRRKVKFTVDESMGEDAVKLVLTLKDGSQIEQAVEHATGSPDNPMSDEFLATKFMTLASETLGEKDASELLDKLWHLDDAKTLSGLVP